MSTQQDHADNQKDGAASMQGDRPRTSCLRRLARWLQWAVNLAALTAAVLVFTPAGDRLGRALVQVNPLAKADYIVVLGGDLERAVEGARLYRDGWAPKLTVSSTPNEAEALARVAAMYGVPAGDILIDRQATRTADHPRTVAAIAGLDPRRRVIVVTSILHTSRARGCFTAGGYAEVCMRAPQWDVEAKRMWEITGTPLLARAGDLPNMLYETLAWGLYKLRGWV